MFITGYSIANISSLRYRQNLHTIYKYTKKTEEKKLRAKEETTRGQGRRGGGRRHIGRQQERKRENNTSTILNA